MNKNYIIIGDSITYGIGDYDTLGWATMLKKEIVNKDGTDMCSNLVHIAGFPGATSTEVLERIDNIYRTFQYKGFENIIILAIGINDVYEYGSNGENSLEEYISNMRCIIDYVKKQKIGLILVGLTKVEEEEEYINGLIIDYDIALKHLAKESDIDYIPMYDAIGELDLIDGLHPTQIGHEKIFSRIINYIEE